MVCWETVQRVTVLNLPVSVLDFAVLRNFLICKMWILRYTLQSRLGEVNAVTHKNTKQKYLREADAQSMLFPPSP